LPENTYNPPNTAAVVTSWTDQQDRRTIGLIAVAVTAVVWSWPTIFVKILSEDFGIFTQSFYRYLSSSAFFFAVSFLFMRDGLKKAAANIRVLIIPALLVSLFQICMVTSVYMTNASVPGIVTRMNIVFIVLFSYILFEEERRVISSKYFLIANAFVMAGVLGLVLGAPNLDLEFNLGVVVAVLAALFWSIYIVSLKRIVKIVGPIEAFPFIQLMAALIFLPILLFSEDISKVTSVSPATNLLLVLSGVTCVGLGNIMNYVAIGILGSTIPSNLLTFKPVLTVIFAYLLLGEVLTIAQISAGLLLILGCWIMIRKVSTRYEEIS
jgi:drug/metabolite transporter (DMT)-like permease